ncbi:MAG: hypothetical protein HN975_08675 [Anaerolineae bacterium]|mgnify:CR=1 FL=1|jgi:hypothetical protein|nr:hypothetical protein [Anaerolineae bacterium]
MKFQVNLNVEYVPLPEDKYAAWEEAMRILVRWLMEIILDTPAERTDVDFSDT